ncbi:MAG: hypothetical protein NT049_00020 [Planctomycetota bacterium]|nr:hypothetical protein [Planctomycetota bacterium]
MRLSNRQKAILHQAAQAAGYDRVMDAQGILHRERYRLVLRKIAGVESSTDPRFSHQGFIRVMAFFEGEAGGRLRGFSPGYWLEQDRQSDPGDSLRFACRREADALGWSDEDLDKFVASPRCSSGRHHRLADAPRYWLMRALDAMKAIRGRGVGGSAQESSTVDSSPPAATTAATEAAEKYSLTGEVPF